MGKRKNRGKKKCKRRASYDKIALHRETECARKIIQSHRSVNGEVGIPRFLTNGGFDINFEMSVSLPSRVNKKGMTETGVKSREPVILRFRSTYPFQAPAILLRPDFNTLLPLINPILRLDGKSYIAPCIYDGPLDDLLHQEGDGMSGIFNQLSEWLAKAAIDDLIDPRQGWEPIRRDDTFGWIVYDLQGFRSLIQDKEGALVFRCKFWEYEERKEKLYFVGRIDHYKQRDLTPWLIKNSFFTDKRFLKPSYVSLMIFAWSNSKVIVDRYLPESIYSLHQLQERAKEYGCYEVLRNLFISLCWAIKEASLDMPVFPIFIILCARRPCDLIGDNSSLELIPYVIECHVDDAQLPFSESAIRIREDSPVFPLGQQPDNKAIIFPDNTRLVIESTGSMAVRELLVALPPQKLKGRLLHAALYEVGKIGIMAIEGHERNPNVCDLVIRFWDVRVDDHDIRSRIEMSSDSMSLQEIGLGCGSHTMVMPDTRVSLYAAGIAERARQMLLGGSTQNGELWIGILKTNELQVSWRLIELGQTKVLSLKAKNDWEIRILKQASDQITQEAQKYSEIETGGVLIGRISLTRRCFTISRVIEAPPDSKRSKISFILGTQGLKEKVEEIHSKSSGFLNYVGTWHSHPKGGGPSALDKDSLEQMKRLRFGAPAVSLIWTPSGFKAIIDEGKLS